MSFADDEINKHLDDDVTLLVVSDDDEPESLTDKYGNKLRIGVFFGIVVLAFFIVAAIFYWSRKHEQRKRARKEAKKEQRTEELTSSLRCTPFCGKPSTDMTATVATRFDTQSFCSEDMEDLESQQVPSSPSALSSGSAHTNVTTSSNGSTGSNTTDQQQPPQPKDGSICPICQEEYKPGQPMYKSNNPRCLHEHHKKCMDMWLRCQNTCPTCNLPFAIHASVEEK